jgi:hypothetical protein
VLGEIIIYTIQIFLAMKDTPNVREDFWNFSFKTACFYKKHRFSPFPQKREFSLAKNGKSVSKM